MQDERDKGSRYKYKAHNLSHRCHASFLLSYQLQSVTQMIKYLISVFDDSAELRITVAKPIYEGDAEYTVENAHQLSQGTSDVDYPEISKNVKKGITGCCTFNYTFQHLNK